MRSIDAVGYLASSLVPLTFYMKSMLRLRIVALCSNLAFIVYGFSLDLMPVALLHLGLVPINVTRLWQSSEKNADIDRLIASEASQGTDAS
jgi:CRP/FNR family cyclic AMP-dependent transcriptional regulator